MRLLAVADLHYSLPQFDWVLEVAPDFDVVVLAGDLLELASIVDRRAQAVVIRKYFERLRAVTRLVICSGNHDLDSPNDTGEKVANWLAASPDDGIISDGESVERDGVLITACPWWDGPITRRRIAAQLAEAAKIERKLWIWIHHAPPDKSPTSWGGARYFGDTELVQWIVEYKPDIVLSGTCINRPSSRMAPGSTASGRPGCSMQGSNSVRRRRISSSTPRSARLCGFPPQAINTSASASRSSGLCRGSSGFRTGSKPGIGLSLRAGCEFFVLLVDQRLQHLPDHAEMIAMPLELALDVDQIGGGGV